MNKSNKTRPAKYVAAPKAPIKSAWNNPLKVTTAATTAAPKRPPGIPAKTPPPELRDRFLHLLQQFVGQNVTVTTTFGAEYSGIFHTFTPFKSSSQSNTYVLKAVRTLQPPNCSKTSTTTHGIVKEGSTVLLKAEHVVSLKIASIRLQDTHRAAAANFATDTDISHMNGNTAAKELVPASSWVTPETSSNGNGKSANSGTWTRGQSLNKTQTNSNSGPLSGKIGAWDQFETNATKFGVKDTFDENLYTTEIDYSKLDGDQVRRAEKMAKEIESSGNLKGNVHMELERNRDVDVDIGEEELYSGVLREEDVSKANLVDGAKPPSSDGDNAPKEEEETVSSTKAKTKTITSVDKDSPKEEAKRLPEKTTKTTKTTKTKAKPAETETTTQTKESTDEKIDGDPTKKDTQLASKSKLNPSAKSFSFNPTAKAFTPTTNQQAAQSTTNPYTNVNVNPNNNHNPYTNQHQHQHLNPMYAQAPRAQAAMHVPHMYMNMPYPYAAMGMNAVPMPMNMPGPMPHAYAMPHGTVMPHQHQHPGVMPSHNSNNNNNTGPQQQQQYGSTSTGNNHNESSGDTGNNINGSELQQHGGGGKNRRGGNPMNHHHNNHHHAVQHHNHHSNHHNNHHGSNNHYPHGNSNHHRHSNNRRHNSNSGRGGRHGGNNYHGGGDHGHNRHQNNSGSNNVQAQASSSQQKDASTTSAEE